MKTEKHIKAAEAANPLHNVIIPATPNNDGKNNASTQPPADPSKFAA